jgi:hypothetical protein
MESNTVAKNTGKVASPQGGAISPAYQEEDKGVFIPEGFSVGSRIVHLYPIERFSMLPDKREIKDDVIKKVGSTWKAGTSDIVRGLRREVKYVNTVTGEVQIVNEEAKYLPKIIGIAPTSEQWESAAKEYWCDYVIAVPLTSSKALEIGFTPAGDPINLANYIAYCFCKDTKYVAVTKEEIDNRTSEEFKFYIEDKTAGMERQKQEAKNRREIEKVFLSLAAAKLPEDIAKIDYILQLIGGQDGTGMVTTHIADKEDKLLYLEQAKTKFPKEFFALASDKDLRTKALIRNAIRIERLKQEGSYYFIAGTRVASSQAELIAYLTDPNNVGTSEMLEQAIKEFDK